MAITLIGSGAWEDAVGVSTTPDPPAGLATDDFKLVMFYSRENVDGTVTTPAGYTEIYNERTSGGILAAWYKLHVGGDGTPTVSVTLHTTGSSGDDLFSKMMAFRGVDPTDPIAYRGAIATNISQQDIGPVEGFLLPRGAALIMFGGKRDDATDVGQPTPDDGLVLEQGATQFSTAGADALATVRAFINSGLEVMLSNKSLQVSGGAAAAGKAVMLALRPLVSAFTAAADLRWYCAQAHPISDNAPYGGAVDPYRQLVFTPIAAADDLEILSSSASDTAISATLTARTAAGARVTETVTLDGTNAVIFAVAGVVDHVLKLELSGIAVGDVTLRRSIASTTVKVVPHGEIGFKCLFENSYASSSAQKDTYEKGFLKNAHVNATAQNVAIVESADPEAVFTFLLSNRIDDDDVIATRLTAPDATITLDPDTFDAASKLVPTAGNNIQPGEAIGVYFRLRSATAEPVFDNTYSLQVTGNFG